MISVYSEQKGDRARLYVTGHADYAPTGDIVCAGVSALVGALAAFAAEDAECQHLRVSMEKGRAFFSCRGGGKAFAMAMAGLSAIAAEYPQCVRLISVDDKQETV